MPSFITLANVDTVSMVEKCSESSFRNTIPISLVSRSVEGLWLLASLCPVSKSLANLVHGAGTKVPDACISVEGKIQPLLAFPKIGRRLSPDSCSIPLVFLQNPPYPSLVVLRVLQESLNMSAIHSETVLKEVHRNITSKRSH